MNHEEIELKKNYQINADNPLRATLEDGDIVEVVGTQESGFGTPCNFRVQRLSDRETAAFVPTWVVSHEHLDPLPETADDVASAA